MRPVIALLSDFGSRDHYAGTMKGVILGICPEATLVDITHDVAAARRARGRAAARRDLSLLSRRHGVSGRRRSRRRIGAARHRRRGGRLPLRRARQRRADARSCARRRRAGSSSCPSAATRRPTVTPDVRGPRSLRARGGVAGQGHAALRARARRHRLPAHRHPAAGNRPDRTLRGVVLTVDRFGNLVTNIDRKTFEALCQAAASSGSSPAARPSGGWCRPTPRFPPGEVCALFGSSDHLELAANAVSAADRLGLARHAVVEISRESSSRF